MAEFIPTATETNMGTGEALFHAQKIIDAFSRAIADNNCMTAIPMSVHTQSQDYIDRLTDIKTALGEKPDQKTEDLNNAANTPAQPIQENTPSLVAGLAGSVKKRAQEECFDCGWDDFPEFNFQDIFGNVFADIEAFLLDIEEIGKLNSSACHLAYLLSYTCIPDLIKLLAMLLAYILKLMTRIILGSFSISMLVMAIVGALIDALLQVILTMTKWALGPVQCYIDTLVSVLDLIPTSSNIKENLSKEQQGLLEDISAGEFEAGNKNAKDGYFNQFGKALKKDTTDLNGFMKDQADVAKKAAESMVATWDDIMSLGDFMSCEDIRSGSGILEFAKDIMKAVQLCNLIKAVIEAKSLGNALDEICNPRDKNSGIGGNTDKPQETDPKPLTADQIADIIESAYGRVGQIIESEDGDMGILLEEEVTPKPNRIDIYSCSLNDFIKDSHLDVVLEEGVAIAEEVLKGEGKDPRTNLRPRVSLDDVEISEGSDLLLFGPTDLGYSQDIIEIIDEVVSFKRNKAAEIAAEKDENLKLTPNTLPAKEEVAEANNADASGLTDDGVSQVSDGYIRGTGTAASAISGKIVTKSLQLKCGTISNLEQSLSFID
jgi:hypothetical protein